MTDDVKWVVEAVVIVSAMALVAAIVCFWVDHFNDNQ
jgi:hypothetical protein